jgi:hypothetical protein
MQAHVSSKLASAVAIQSGQNVDQLRLSGSYVFLAGGFLVVMIFMLILTCCYHNDYKRWAAREKIIYQAEHAEVKVNTIMAPQQ